MNGAEFVLHCLKKEGVTQLFGYPGGAVIPLYDALYHEKEIKHIRTCHEQGATHAADGYARATGKVGVCIATSGPGVTNTVTGIATAYMDSIPLVVLSGQVGKGLLGKDSFQEVDITGMTMSITKHNILVKTVDEIGPALEVAFYMAREGRPGPVLVDIVKSALTDTVKDMSYTSRPLLPASGEADYEEELQLAATLLSEAKRPVIYVGGGVISGGHSEALRKFALATGIPVCNSIMGLGAFDRTHPLSYGIVGMHGDVEANDLCHEADVILGVGVRFSDRAIGHRTGFTKQGKIIHVDIDPSELEKNVDSKLNILGNYTAILEYLTEHVSPQTKDWSRSEVLCKEEMHPRNLFALVAAEMPEDTVVVTDVGQHQMWAAKYWPVHHPRGFLTSGGLGTMGFGVGAALGAKCGQPSKSVLLVTGDGSFRMNQHEVLTLSRCQVPVTILLINNNALGMVRQWQGLFCEERYSETDIYDPLDLGYLCKAYGVEYARACNATELKEALQKRDDQKTIVIECMLDHNVWVYPIVPAGGAVNEYIIE